MATVTDPPRGAQALSTASRVAIETEVTDVFLGVHGVSNVDAKQLALAKFRTVAQQARRLQEMQLEYRDLMDEYDSMEHAHPAPCIDRSDCPKCLKGIEANYKHSMIGYQRQVLGAPLPYSNGVPS